MVAEAEEAAISPNAISPNAISPNAISPNAISPNAISPNAISPGALTALSDPGPDGDLSRQFVRFAVGCALTPQQSFQFSWTDDQDIQHNEVYPGLLGLAPWWATGPLGETGQRMVSACLAARANYSGTTVLISMRSEYDALHGSTTSSELAAYPYLEGAFWGDVFASTPHLHACHVPANDAHAHAAARECASGHVDPATGQTVACGPIILEGPCSEVCSRFDGSDKLYDHCLNNPATSAWWRTSLVITTALP